MRERFISVVLIVSMLLSTLAGCSPANHVAQPTGTTENTAAKEAEEPSTEATSESTTAPAETEVIEAPTEAPTEPPTEPEPTFTIEQQNSINMMNYLAALVTEINASSGSRVYLEEVYLDLMNNTDPSKIDDYTLQQYNSILDLLEGYRMIDVKRERLEYIYDQNRANSLRSAMPSPMSILNVVESRNALKAVASLIYLAVDSVNSYNSRTSELDAQYLQDNWNLDDQEAQYLHNSRTDMFTYLVKITGNYDIPGVITLNEEFATEFVKCTKNTNVNQRIDWLERKVETYRYFGEYWLVLAQSYYEDNNYQKCLDAVREYEALNISIYRNDYKFAEVLPYAIVSAKETMSETNYTEFAADYAQILLDNADQYDWAKQYFACQTYIELFTLTDDADYLQKAYTIARGTASDLVEEQERLNREYLMKLEKKKAEKDVPAKKKQEIEEYNEYIEYLTEIRETELPPVYEPLRLFCELLVGLAAELDLTAAEKAEAENILRERNNNGQLQNIFLDCNLDNQYRFNLMGFEISLDDIPIDFNGKKLTIPAQYVSDASVIVLSLNDQNISDWTVNNIDRNKSANIEDFSVIFTSETVKDIKFNDGDTVKIEIFPYDGAENAMTFSFVVEKGFPYLITDFVRR